MHTKLTAQFEDGVLKVHRAEKSGCQTEGDRSQSRSDTR